MKRVAVIALFLCLCGLPGALAQNRSEAELQALLDRALKAHGGSEGIAKIGTQSVVEGEMEIRKPIPNKLGYRVSRKGDRMLTRLTTGGQEILLYLDKEGGWRTALGQFATLSDAELKVYRSAQRIQLGTVLKKRDKNTTLTDLGKKKLPDGLLADALRLTSPDKTPTDVYFDPATGLVAALGYCDMNTERGVEVAFLQRMRDYRPQDGITLNFLTERYEDNALVQIVKISKVDLNADIPDSLFARPTVGPINKTSGTLPFDFATGELVVEASINGGPRRKFLLDTGAGITLLSEELAQKLKLEIVGDGNLGAGGGTIKAKFAKIASLKVGGAEAKDLRVALTNMASFRALIGEDLAGIIGYTFLSQFQVTLDYGKKTLTLVPTDTPLPEGKTVTMETASGIPIVEAKVGETDFKMVLDTGAMWTILPSRVVPKLKIGKSVGGTYGMGFDGKPVELKSTRLPSLSAAGQMVKGSVVSYAEPNANGGLMSDYANGILGNTWLRSFRVTLDYQKQKVVLIPLPAEYTAPDEWIHPGIDVGMVSPGSAPIVARITAGSSADRAGLQLYDRVTLIDGKPIRGLTRYAIAALLRGPENSMVRVTIVRDKKSKTYTLKRMRLL